MSDDTRRLEWEGAYYNGPQSQLFERFMALADREQAQLRACVEAAEAAAIDAMSEGEALQLHLAEYDAENERVCEANQGLADERDQLQNQVWALGQQLAAVRELADTIEQEIAPFQRPPFHSNGVTVVDRIRAALSSLSDPDTGSEK